MEIFSIIKTTTLAKRNNKAFTLSEVMLVLSVIGVIVTLTIPGLMQNTQNRQAVARLKREYSILQQAFTSIAAENDGDITSVFNSYDNSTVITNVFAAKLNVLKNCGTGTGCFYPSAAKELNGNIMWSNTDAQLNYTGKLILANGTLLAIATTQNGCTSNTSTWTNKGPLVYTCGWIHMDINGASGPNTLGRDLFNFYISKTGIIPDGSNDRYPNYAGCDANGPGWSCAGKVLAENAMNY